MSRKRVLNRNFQLYSSAFSLKRRNIFIAVGKEDGVFPIGKLDVQTFPTGKIRDSPLERRNVSLQDMETFPSFPTGREKKTFPSKKEKLFPMGRKTFPNGKGNIYQRERETFQRERRKLFPVGRGNISHCKRKTFPSKIGIHFLVGKLINQLRIGQEKL